MIGVADGVDTWHAATRSAEEALGCQSYVGLSLKDALEAAIGFALEMYRLIDDLHNAISCDPRPDRLSLWVVGGVVSRPAFF
jgi:hypothetical protein